MGVILANVLLGSTPDSIKPIHLKESVKWKFLQIWGLAE